MDYLTETVQSVRELTHQLEELHMPNLSIDELYAFIDDKFNNQRWTWDEIAAELKKRGHKSVRTKDYISAATVRFIYFNKIPNWKAKGPRPAAKSAPSREEAPSGGGDHKLDLIRAALKMRKTTKPEQVLDLIESLLG
jgi:hypothetical protein